MFKATPPSTGFPSVNGAYAKPFNCTPLSTAYRGHVTQRIWAAANAVG